MSPNKISQAFTRFQEKNEAQLALVKPKTFVSSLFTKDEETLKAILATIPYANAPEFRIIKSTRTACFYTESKDIHTSLVNDINGLTNEFNQLLLTHTGDIDWLEKYKNEKDVKGTRFDAERHIVESQKAVNNFELEQLKNEKKSFQYDSKLEQLHNIIKERSFDDEIIAITDYMAAEFSGYNSHEYLHELLKTVFVTLKSNVRGLLFADEYAGQGERIALTEYTFANKDIFNPFYFNMDLSEFKRPNIHQLWCSERERVSVLIKNTFPKLSRNNLSVLLRDEEASIPDTAVFQGLALSGCRTPTLEERLTPKNLRYSQQEQGVKWVDVLAGALVAHYHEFLQIKQSVFIAGKLKSLAADMVNDHSLDLTELTKSILANAAEIAE
jgi:hypothetical protein